MSTSEQKEILEVLEPEEETFVCFSCMRPNEYSRKICKYCNAPISQTSSSDPLQIAYGEGRAYSKATEGKPKFVVLLGVWIIFAPSFIFTILLLPDLFSIAEGMSLVLLFWLAVITIGFSGLMLYRVTKNYFYLEKVTLEDTAEEIEN